MNTIKLNKHSYISYTITNNNLIINKMKFKAGDWEEIKSILCMLELS